jgi:hypothetical protein
MPDFSVRSDSVNVEQIMEQIRARIREKRGTDYTEQQIRELASVKLEKFLDPRGVRSDLLDAYRRAQAAHTPPAPPNYAFGEETLFETHRGPLRAMRRLLMPILKLFWNPNPLIQALHIQAELNTINAQRETERRGLDQLHFEVLHNLVLETTRMGIEIKNLKMKVESLTGRLEFNERRARALESAVVYRPLPDERSEPRPPAPPQRSAPPPPPPRATQPGAAAPSSAPTPQGNAPEGQSEGPGQRSRRRRRRRGRRGGGGSAASILGGQTENHESSSETGSEALAETSRESEFDAAGPTDGEGLFEAAAADAPTPSESGRTPGAEPAMPSGSDTAQSSTLQEDPRRPEPGEGSDRGTTGSGSDPSTGSGHSGAQ